MKNKEPKYYLIIRITTSCNNKKKNRQKTKEVILAVIGSL